MASRKSAPKPASNRSKRRAAACAAVAAAERVGLLSPQAAPTGVARGVPPASSAAGSTVSRAEPAVRPAAPSQDASRGSMADGRAWHSGGSAPAIAQASTYCAAR